MTTEFAVDLDQEGQGELIITDARVLVQPRKVPGQYPASVPHDTVHAAGILMLGDDMGMYTWHIISPLSPAQTYKLLDRVFYAYVDGCCMSLWCDAIVSYIVNNEIVARRTYGFDDGSYTQAYRVYCSVSEGETDRLVNEIIGDPDVAEHYIVVRPDSSELGYTVQGFTGEADHSETAEEDILEDSGVGMSDK